MNKALMMNQDVPSSHCDGGSTKFVSAAWDSFRGLARNLFGKPGGGNVALLDDPLPGDMKSFKDSLTQPLMKLGANTSKRQVSYAASAFLFRKLLPSPPGTDPLPGYLEKLAKTPLVNDAWMRSAELVVSRVFGPGWDHRYAAACDNVTINTSSCTELSSERGGSREFLRMAITREDFVQSIKSGVNLQKIPTLRKVAVLEDGGKKRLVTVASAWQAQLLPLHTLLYEHLSEQPWLLRGDADPEALKGLGGRADTSDVFVSGDYEAATDNFNASHSQRLLRLIQKSSSHIPSSVWDLAVSSLTGEVTAQGFGRSAQNNGQLMGNYLSFPLLCLTNFCAFMHAFRGNPERGWWIARWALKINGDDIVFRCRREEYELWATAVSASGLVLSRGKTLVHKRYFSINSTFFRAIKVGPNAVWETKPELVPVIRSAPLFTRSSTWAGIVGRLEVVTVGWRGRRREMIQGWFLRWRRNPDGLLECAGNPWCSLTRGSGLRISGKTLEKAPWWAEREYTILQSPSKMDRPPKIVVDGKSEKGAHYSRRAERYAGGSWRCVPQGKVDRERLGSLRQEWVAWCVKKGWGEVGSGSAREVPGVHYADWVPSTGTQCGVASGKKWSLKNRKDYNFELGRKRVSVGGHGHSGIRIMVPAEEVLLGPRFIGGGAQPK